MADPIPTAPKILIVEDERLVAMDVEMQLTSFGYDVVGMADTGQQALQLVEATQPDLVLMDVSLRGERDGISIASELQQSGNTTPIVFVTAYGSGEALRRAETVCFSGYLTKPYRPQQLRDAVLSALLKYENQSCEPLSSPPKTTS